MSEVVDATGVDQSPEQPTEEQAALPAEETAKAASALSDGEKLELFERIETAEEHARSAKRKMEHAKVVFKQAKEDYEAAVEEVHALAGAGKEDHPLFDGAATDGGDDGGDEDDDVELAADEQEAATGVRPAQPADARWRQNGVCAAGFSNAEDDLLDTAEIKTLGQLQDLIDGHGTEDDVTRWRGLGTAACNRIAKKLRRFLDEIHALPAGK